MDTYIIGEIGQNHNGSVDIAKKIIDTSTEKIVDELFGTTLPCINAIKLTKRDLEHELTHSEYCKPYNSPNSFGATYGEHREYLELDNMQHYDIYQYAVDKGLQVVETICGIRCLNLLNLFLPDYIKVASRDLNNLPLLNAIAETHIPMIISTGMSGIRELDEALEVITEHHMNVTILHCVSEYPTRYENVNLNTIPYLKKHYGYRIGYSDHTIGISSAVAAVAMGAEVIEKHITLDRTMKGTDQAGSLSPIGLKRMVRDIRNLEQSMGIDDMLDKVVVKDTKKKLGRSIATIDSIPIGEEIREDNIQLLSPATGLAWRDRYKIIGKKVSREIPANEIIQWSDL